MRRAPRGPIIPKSATDGHIILRPQTGPEEFWTWATCEQADCAPWRNGWEVTGSVVTEQHLADFRRWGYRYTVLDLPGDAGRLLFEAGQTCFDARTQAHAHGRPTPGHRVPLEREPLYVLRNKRGKQQVSATQWVDVLHENTDRVATLRARG